MANVPKEPAAKRGALSIDELLEFWKSVVDTEYSQPLVSQIQGLSVDAGEDVLVDPGNLVGPTGSGIEVHTQAMAQSKRLSQAVERTCEGMFILPWSGQTEEPASGAQKATVVLTLERDKRLETTITFTASTIVEEVTVEPGPEAGERIAVGRRYVLRDSVTFVPGERGPKTVTAVAEKEGFGFNNPLPGAIDTIVQPGAGLQNDEATLVPGISTHRLQVDTEPDVVVPENVGQYIEFVAGSNLGEVRRMVAYGQADPGVPHGGEAVLARTGVFRVTGVTGTFEEGEEVEQATTGAKGNFVALSSGTIVLERTDALFATGFVVTGAESGATATIDFILQSSDLAAEAITAVWKVLDWKLDLGFTVTNTAQPSDGKAAMLDELGAGRRIARSPGETDDDYRQRVAKLPDTVAPNAILRAGNRILAPFGARICLREAGEPEFPGFAYGLDAYDYDFDLQPGLQFNLLVSYEEMRAFFLVAVPPLNLGEFGFSYDVGATAAYDIPPFLVFYDGFPLTAAILYRNIFQAIDKKRAGGVGFDLVIDPTCAR